MMENDRNTIKNYLQLAGVPETIITFLDKKTGVLLELRDFLDEDFIIGFHIHQTKCVEKLKRGNEKFKILENGNVWFLSTYTPKALNFSSNLYTGSIALSENEKYISIRNKNYVAMEDNQLIVRKMEEKQKSENVFDGVISETVYTPSLSPLKKTTGYWFDSPSCGLPDQELSFDIEEFNEFGFSTHSSCEGNCNTELWNFVYSGERVQKQEVSVEKKSGIKETLKRLKSALFNKKLSSSEDMERGTGRK